MVRIMCLSVVLCLTALSVCAEEPAKPSVKAAQTEVGTKEMIDYITAVSERGDEVMDYVPGFRKETDPSGTVYYTYNGTRLEKLDKDKLASLYSRIQAERSRLNADRISRQMEAVRQAQQAQQAANATRQIPKVPQAVNQPPKPPAPTPPSSSQIPRAVPKAPPGPPPSPRR